MNELMGYCGLVCNTCPIYAATRERNRAERTRMRSEIAAQCNVHYGMHYEPENITDCDGCRTEGGRLFSACDTCSIRTCARQRAIETCASCGEYPCETLESFFATESTARMRLDKIRSAMR